MQISYTLHNLPSTEGVAYCKPTSKPSKGKASDRYAKHILETYLSEDSTGDDAEKDTMSQLRAESATWKRLAQQSSEIHTPTKTIDFNESVAIAAGITDENVRKKEKSTAKKVPLYTRFKDDVKYNIKSKMKPHILPFDPTQVNIPPLKSIPKKGRWKRVKTAGQYINEKQKQHDKEIKRKTGFLTEKAMLAFISVVCNGDIKKIQKRKSVLTWYEEWMLFFEFTWGRTKLRWADLSASDSYGIDDKMARTIFDSKMNIIIECREWWPAFTTFEEDKEMSDDKYKKRYHNEGTRPIFWDMTNVSIPKPSESRLQGCTYSSYYAQNCFKGGIGVQTCGWIRTHDLWTGGVSDTTYQGSSGIFEKQREFVEINDDENKVPFTNIFDKGYRNRLAAWQAGHQLTLQPSFAKSDSRFRRRETLSSAIVAADRSGNERAVRITKMAGYIGRGLDSRQSIERVDKAWLAWGFQVNFMFKSVL